MLLSWVYWSEGCSENIVCSWTRTSPSCFFSCRMNCWIFWYGNDCTATLWVPETTYLAPKQAKLTKWLLLKFEACLYVSLVLHISFRGRLFSFVSVWIFSSPSEDLLVVRFLRLPWLKVELGTKKLQPELAERQENSQEDEEENHVKQCMTVSGFSLWRAGVWKVLDGSHLPTWSWSSIWGLKSPSSHYSFPVDFLCGCQWYLSITSL